MKLVYKREYLEMEKSLYQKNERRLYKESEEAKRGKRLRLTLRLNINVSCKAM